ncbi:hypothetical protein Emed_006520 [Eimeria media]
MVRHDNFSTVNQYSRVLGTPASYALQQHPGFRPGSGPQPRNPRTGSHIQKAFLKCLITLHLPVPRERLSGQAEAALIDLNATVRTVVCGALTLLSACKCISREQHVSKAEGGEGAVATQD